MTSTVAVWWSSLVAADRVLETVLDPVERDRLAAMQRPADRGRSLVGFAVLRAAAAQHLGVDPTDVVIDRTCDDCGEPHGRPRVVGPTGAGPWVSVSHSGVLVVVALSDAAASGGVGVDVQRIADLDGASADRSTAAAERWVRGEAVSKLGALADDASVHVSMLRTPTAGYAAALAVVSADVVGVAVGHWPPASR